MAIVVGVTSALQSRINGELASRIGNSSQAAVISFATGLALLCILLLVLPTMRAGLRRLPAALRSGALPRWQLLGGLGGGSYVAVQTAVVPVIGVALFAVSGVAGQTLASLYVDKVGLGPAGRQVVTPTRIAAAALAVIAVVVSASDRLGSATFSVLAVVAGLAAGAALAVQGAINGRVSVAARSPLSASWVNFVVGTLLLLALLAFRTGTGGPAITTTRQAWWLYSGGAIGVLFVATAAFVIAHLGVLVFTLCQIAGQVVGAVVLDLVAPVGGEHVTVVTLAGAALTLLAIVVGTGLLHRPRQRSAG
ncbi:MAG: DMT family transporter [Candidatus Nanopelagicales bacterium]